MHQELTPVHPPECPHCTYLPPIPPAITNRTPHKDNQTPFTLGTPLRADLMRNAGPLWQRTCRSAASRPTLAATLHGRVNWCVDGPGERGCNLAGVWWGWLLAAACFTTGVCLGLGLTSVAWGPGGVSPRGYVGLLPACVSAVSGLCLGCVRPDSKAGFGLCQGCVQAVPGLCRGRGRAVSTLCPACVGAVSGLTQSCVRALSGRTLKPRLHLTCSCLLCPSLQLPILAHRMEAHEDSTCTLSPCSQNTAQPCLRLPFCPLRLCPRVEAHEDGTYTLFYKDGEGKEGSIRAGRVMMATGRRPSTQNIGLEVGKDGMGWAGGVGALDVRIQACQVQGVGWGTGFGKRGGPLAHVTPRGVCIPPPT